MPYLIVGAGGYLYGLYDDGLSVTKGIMLVAAAAGIYYVIKKAGK